tara:strand:- start:4818 stop:5426 length:609 start_codon:yes stop_codon:yes gene_type:complete
MKKKVYIGTSRDIGHQCINWAKDNIPAGFELVDDMYNCDIFISVLYEKLINLEFIKNRKCFNFHPGILPQYRGAGVYSWAIINGDDKTGITLHLIDEGIDSGDIIEIRAFPINKHQDTAQTLFEKGNNMLFTMFTNWFHLLLNDQYDAVAQDESQTAIYYRKDLEKVKDLTRYIRAFTFDSKESAYYINGNGNRVYIDYKED